MWCVKTCCIGDNVYFDDGWKVFREENSLEEVDFLVFKYDGINEFRFIILEQSTSCGKTIVKEEEEEHEEIEEYAMEDRKEQSQEEDGEDDDDSDNNNEEEEDGYDDSDSDEYTDMEEENEEENIAGNMRSQCHHRARKISRRETPTSSYTKARDPQHEDYEVEAAMYIQPDNPYFVAKVYKCRPNELIPKNVIKDYSLIFPAKVTLVCCQCKGKQRNEVREYHLSLPQQTIVCGKYEEVEGELCTWKDGGACIQGWISFCRKNKINEKDVCLCEIVVEEEQVVKLLQVHVLSTRK